MAKIVYNVIINTGSPDVGKNGYITYHKVNCINKFKLFATNKYPNWIFANVYNNLTREKIQTITR